MSLFDVIKYGNTDLGSKEELGQLPASIIIKYFDRLVGANYNHYAIGYLRSHYRWDPISASTIFQQVLKDLP